MMRRLLIVVVLLLLLGSWHLGCATTGTRTPNPDGTETVTVKSGPGGGSVRWPDGTYASVGSLVEKFGVMLGYTQRNTRVDK